MQSNPATSSSNYFFPPQRIREALEAWDPCWSAGSRAAQVMGQGGPRVAHALCRRLRWPQEMRAGWAAAPCERGFQILSGWVSWAKGGDIAASPCSSAWHVVLGSTVRWAEMRRVTPHLWFRVGSRCRQIPALTVCAAGSTDACWAHVLPGLGSIWLGRAFVVLSIGLRHPKSWGGSDQGLATSWWGFSAYYSLNIWEEGGSTTLMPHTLM